MVGRLLGLLTFTVCVMLSLAGSPALAKKSKHHQVFDFTGDDQASSNKLPETIRGDLARQKRKSLVYQKPGSTKVAPRKAGSTAAQRLLAKSHKKPANLVTDSAGDRRVAGFGAPVIESKRPLNSVELRTSVQGLVFALETRLDQTAAKASYGTAFVVGTDGLLMTNYHVVSQAVLNPTRYQLYLKTEDSELKAQVVNFDVLNDLAVVRIDRKFPRALSLDTRLPTRGEKIFSVGLPQDTSMTLVEGIFSDEQSAGFTKFLVLSSPLNPGMSGGPTLDATGSVVGINEGMLATAQNISFLVPGIRAGKFYERAKATVAANQKLSRSESESRREIQRQVASFDGGWRQSWEHGKTVELRDWKLTGIPAYLRCWQDRKSASGTELDTELMKCQTLATILIGENTQAGAVDIELRSTEELSFYKVFYNLNNLREKTFRPVLAEFTKNSVEDNHLGKYICDHQNIRSSNNLAFLAEVCMTRVNREHPLFDTVVFLTLLQDSPNKLMARMQLSGFTREQSLFAMQQFVQGIQFKERP